MTFDRIRSYFSKPWLWLFLPNYCFSHLRPFHEWSGADIKSTGIVLQPLCPVEMFEASVVTAERKRGVRVQDRNPVIVLTVNGLMLLGAGTSSPQAASLRGSHGRVRCVCVGGGGCVCVSVCV